jgi:DNA-binding transcriptional LysR family regulator
MRTAQVEAVARLAAAGIGLGMVPIKNVPLDLSQNVRGIDPPVAWRVWAYVAAPELSGVAAAFAQVLGVGSWQRTPIRGRVVPTPFDRESLSTRPVTSSKARSL